MTDFAMEGDNTKITTSYKELDRTVDVGSTICVSLEQSTQDYARMEVTEVMEVSRKLDWLTSACTEQRC